MSDSLLPDFGIQTLQFAIASDPRPLRFKDLASLKTGPCFKHGEPGYETAGIEIQLAFDGLSNQFFTLHCKTPFALAEEQPRIAER